MRNMGKCHACVTLSVVTYLDYSMQKGPTSGYMAMILRMVAALSSSEARPVSISESNASS